MIAGVNTYVNTFSTFFYISCIFLLTPAKKQSKIPNMTKLHHAYIITALALLAANTCLQLAKTPSSHIYTTTELHLSPSAESRLNILTDELGGRISRAISSIEHPDPVIPDYSKELEAIKESLKDLEYLEYLQDLQKEISSMQQHPKKRRFEGVDFN